VLDVQVTGAIGSVAIIVVVKGDVALGSDPKQQFMQNFVLVNATPTNPETWRVLSDCFRFV
jgi:hypothetical protein